jgi:ATP-dependent Clp protease ATP-binding subunit ClpB
MANEQMNPNPEAGVNPLEKYGINLTELSKEGKIDPVIGREDEIRRIVQILSRRLCKNNMDCITLSQFHFCHFS